jgi:hypothetical protein
MSNNFSQYFRRNQKREPSLQNIKNIFKSIQIDKKLGGLYDTSRENYNYFLIKQKLIAQRKTEI